VAFNASVYLNTSPMLFADFYDILIGMLHVFAGDRGRPVYYGGVDIT
jgi:hypothetical protein